MKSSNSTKIAAATFAVITLLHVPFTVQAASTGAPVTVVNTTNAPVFVRDVDQARQPFQAFAAPTADTGDRVLLTTNMLPVPAGKRAVIELVTVQAFTGGESLTGDILVDVDDPGNHFGHALALIKEGCCRPIGTFPIRLYADKSVVVRLQRDADSGYLGFVQARVTLSGYFVDLP